jgi:hypothetical protein
MRNKSIYAFPLIEEFFIDFEVLKTHLKVDYYFYMFLRGLTPKYTEGKPLNVHNDIEQGALSIEVLKRHEVPLMESLLPKDQLAINTLFTINKALADLHITPRKGSIILYYKCPSYMTSRVISQFRKIIKANMVETQLQPSKQQPLAFTELDFKDSVDSLIGIHKNIIAIILWKRCDTLDNTQQMLGRCMRLNTFNTQLYFYITATTNDFD